LKTTLYDFSKVQPTNLPGNKARFDSNTTKERWNKTKEKKIPTFSEYYKETLPEGWEIPEHIKLICSYLDKVDSGEIDRLAIHMPPRHGKSETVTIRYAAYRAEYYGKENLLVSGYSDRFTRRMSRKIRNLVSERIELSKDNKAADEWTTKDGGTFLGRGCGAPITGIGVSRIILDDVIKSRQEAESEVIREAHADWYFNDCYSRLEPGGAIIIMATKWHYDDITYKAANSEPGKWTIVNIPAICEDENDPLNRNIGEALWPNRYDIDSLKRIRSTVGEYAFQSLYQQNPSPKSGSFFLPDNIKITNNLPPIKRKVRGWDLASTKDGDYTVGILLGMTEDDTPIILDVIRGQFEVSERDRLILQTVQSDGIETKQIFPLDPGQAGVSQKHNILKLLQGYKVEFKAISGSKKVRAEIVASQCNGGMVCMSPGIWNRALLDELRTFPMGSYDDQVDALAEAYNGIINNIRRMIAV